jgi:Tfp pilus assembly protein PilF
MAALMLLSPLTSTVRSTTAGGGREEQLGSSPRALRSPGGGLAHMRGGGAPGGRFRIAAHDAEALMQGGMMPSYLPVEQVDSADGDSAEVAENNEEASSDSADAEWLYREVLDTNPADITAHGALADILHRKGDVDGAVRCLDQALAIAPADWQTLYSQAMLLMRRVAPGDSDTATGLLARALEVDPASVPTLHLHGRLLHALHGRLEEAEDMYRRALFYEPGRGDILSDYGALLEAKGSDRQAVRGMYKRAALLAPSHADALSNYARVLEEGGGADGPGSQDPTHTALALYRRALAARPNHVPTMCNLALTLSSGAGGGARRMEGMELLERACALRPSHVGAVCQLARLLQEDGQTERAREMYDSALALNPQMLDALNGLGTMYEARAQAVLSGADNDDADARAKHQQLLGMARSMYARALKLAPLHPDTLSNRAALIMCHEGPAGRDEAERLFRLALGVRPNHAAALYNYGFLCQVENRMQEAMELYERAYELQPFRSEVASALAQFSGSRYAKNFIQDSSGVDPVAEHAAAEARWRSQYPPEIEHLHNSSTPGVAFEKAGVHGDGGAGGEWGRGTAEEMLLMQKWEAIKAEKAKEEEERGAVLQRKRKEREAEAACRREEERKGVAEVLLRGGLDERRKVEERDLAWKKEQETRRLAGQRGLSMQESGGLGHSPTGVAAGFSGVACTPFISGGGVSGGLDVQGRGVGAVRSGAWGGEDDLRARERVKWKGGWCPPKDASPTSDIRPPPQPRAAPTLATIGARRGAGGGEGSIQSNEGGKGEIVEENLEVVEENLDMMLHVMAALPSEADIRKSPLYSASIW